MAGRRASAVRLLGLAILYFAGAAAGAELSREGGNVAAFWPPNAILLGLLLRRPDWGLGPPVAACALANVLLNLVLGDPVVIAAGFAVANALEVACAYRLVAGWAGIPFDLSSLRQVAVFCGAGVLAAAVGASLGAALVGHHFQAPFGAVWRTWWTADVVGMLLIAPLIVAWDGGRRLRQVMAAPGCLPGLELAAALALLGAAFWLVVGQGWPGSPTLFVPVLLWLALRFGVGATAAAALTVCLAAPSSPRPRAPGRFRWRPTRPPPSGSGCSSSTSSSPSFRPWPPR